MPLNKDIKEYEALMKRMGPYTRFLQEKLALKDWQFTLELNLSEDDGDAYATWNAPDGRKQGIITLNRLFFEQDEDSQKHTLCHELIHSHLRQVSVVGASVSKLIGDAAYGILEGLLDDAVEQAVDGISDAMAKMLPTLREWENSKS